MIAPEELANDKIIEFEKELGCLINKHSMENLSDTPDFILARYLVNCLRTFTITTEQRDEWYGNKHEIDLQEISTINKT